METNNFIQEVTEEQFKAVSAKVEQTLVNGENIARADMNYINAVLQALNEINKDEHSK